MIPGAADAVGEAAPSELTVDVLVIGGGPAGLSAALNLGRARSSVVVVDAGRPRNAATLRSHGFLTRDGISPIELRKLARAELTAYPEVHFVERASVSRLTEVVTTEDADRGIRFVATLDGRRAPSPVRARSVIVATGIRESLPDVPGLRSFYGMTIFSCAACDGWEVRDRALAFIGETRDVAERARLLARWSDRLTVFTNGTDAVDAAEEAELAASGIAVDRRQIAELLGERGTLSAVRLVDGERVAVDGGFVRPTWTPALDFADGLDVERDLDGHLLTDRSGRTSLPGLYAAGDAAAPGPQQLIVAAGQGARAAAVLVHDTVGVRTAH